MKKISIFMASILLVFALVFSLTACELTIKTNTDTQGSDTSTGDTGGNNTDGDTSDGAGGEDFTCPNGHTDEDQNNYCDACEKYLIVVIDFYAINDLHGKFCDNGGQPGVDELGTYFELCQKQDEHTVLLSSGDMWQGTAESVLTYGEIMVDWMNELGFVSMTLGNHEFDWGEDIVRENAELAEFPFLAINIYDNITGKLADYCTPSVMIERGDIQIGIIGAIGDCYSSISSDMVTDIHFKVGDELTNLVKQESLKLRGMGADLIVYSLHDGSNSSFGHYDTALSNGYVDVVFEGHSHQAYVRNDSYGITHIQGGGENYGLSHVEIAVNSVTGQKSVTEKNLVTSDEYENLDDHEPTEEIEDKYAEIIEFAYRVLGTVSKRYSSDALADYVAELYLDAGTEKWANEYDVVYGGGFLKTRDPYDLSAGETTYADLLSLLPFNNRIVLCKISGSNLKSKLIENTNSSYHGAVKDGFSVDDINPTGVYYVVVDTYTAQYRSNNLTIVEYYDESTYARDLLADAIEAGKLTNSSGGTTQKPEIEYEITPISKALEIGEALEIGGETTEFLYYKGTIDEIVQPTYGNCYLTDELGNTIYVYGLKDESGTRYDGLANQPTAGDVIIVRANVKKYQYPSTGDIVVELINSVILGINP